MGCWVSFLLVGFLIINVEKTGIPVIRSGVMGGVGRIENVLVGHPALKFERSLPGEYPACSLSREEVGKLLRRYILRLSSTHSDWRYLGVIRWRAVFNNYVQVKSNVFSSCAPEVLELQNYASICSIQDFSHDSTRVQGDIRPFSKAESQFSNLRTLLSGIGSDLGCSSLCVQKAEGSDADENTYARKNHVCNKPRIATGVRLRDYMRLPPGVRQTVKR